MFATQRRARRTHIRALRMWNRGEHDAATVHVARALELLTRPRNVSITAVTAQVGVLFILARFASELTEHHNADRLLSTAVHHLRDLPPGWQRDLLLSEALVRLGDNARLAGRFEDARAALIEGRDLTDTAHLDPTRRAGALNALGILAKDTGHHAEATAHYTDALALLEAELGEDSPQLASLHHSLAGLAHAQGNYSAAEAPARRALHLRQLGQPVDGAGLAGDRSVLAAVLIEQRRYDEAEPLLGEALTYWTERSGPHHYEIAVNLHNLAAIHRGRGDLTAAEHALATALQITEHVLGGDHPEVTRRVPAWPT